MLVEHLTAMLFRRGYTVTLFPEEGAMWVETQERAMPLNIASITYARTDPVFYIDEVVGGGQHHMRCRQCSAPILRAVASSNPRATHETTCWYEFRAVAAGLAATPIRVCPGCGVELDIGTVAEIEDT